MELLLLIIGAVFGVVITEIFNYGKKHLKRINPISIEVIKSSTEPVWFSTNLEPPKNPEQGFSYQEDVIRESVFCGFAKINVRVSNRSEDYVNITNLPIHKEAIFSQYNYRVRTIPQGASSAIRLFVCLDDEYPVFSIDVKKRFSQNGKYFESGYGNKIKIAPGDNEDIYLAFITIEGSWHFNCDLIYKVNGKEKSKSKIFGNGYDIVPYNPEIFVDDYCAFLETVGGDYSPYKDAYYFSDEMKANDPANDFSINSTLDYILGEIG